MLTFNGTAFGAEDGGNLVAQVGVEYVTASRPIERLIYPQFTVRGTRVLQHVFQPYTTEPI